MTLEATAGMPAVCRVYTGTQTLTDALTVSQVISGVAPDTTVVVSVTNQSLSFDANGETIQVPVSSGTVTISPDVDDLGTFTLDPNGVWQATASSVLASNRSHVLFTVASYQLLEDFSPAEGSTANWEVCAVGGLSARTA